MVSRNTTHRRRLKQSDILWAVLMAALVGAIYVPTTSFEFVDYDDHVHVTSNRLVNPPTRRGLLEAWRRPYRNVYMPLTYTVYCAEAWLAQQPDAAGALDAGVFHTGNVLVHAVGAALVFLLLRGLSLAPGAAAIGTLVFGWHPLQVESVAWVSGLSGLLSGAFGVAALWQYVAYVGAMRDEKSTSADLGHASRTTQSRSAKQAARWHYVAATLFLALALLAKPLAAAVPLVAGVVAVGWLGRKWSLVLRDLWCWLAAAVALAVVTKWQQPTELVIAKTNYAERAVVAADAIGFYAGKLVAPFGLTPDYGRTPRVATGGWFGYAAVLGMLATVGAGWWFGLSRKVWTAAAVTVAALGPVLGLVPFGHQNISTVADRYMYAAMLGPALLAGYGWSTTTFRGRWALAVGLLVFWAARSIDQGRHWHDSIALAQHSLKVQPNSAVMHIAWAQALERQGQMSAALQHYRQAVAARPDDPVARYQLGEALIRRRRFAEAETHLRKALQRVPGYTPARDALARAYEGQGRLARALDEYRRLAGAQPQAIGPRLSVARLLLEQGRTDEAMELYYEMRRDMPEQPEVLLVLARMCLGQHDAAQARAYVQQARRVAQSGAAWQEIGSLLLELGDEPAATDAFARAVAIDPRLAEAKNNLAVLLRSQRQLDDARRLLESAVRLRPEAANFRTNLAATLIDLGQIDEALRQLRAALQVDPHYVDAHVLLGVQLERRGQTDAALRHFMAALERQPSNAQLHNHVGVMLAQAGRWKEATRHFSQAVRLAPDDHQAKANLAEAQRRAQSDEAP